MSHPTSKLWRDRISPYRAVRHIGWRRSQRGAAVAPAVYHAAQDGDHKQDCETKAAYRWFDQNAARYASLRPIYLGDDLYANQPICEKVTQAGGDFIFRVKEGSHKTLFSYLDGVTWPTTRVVKKTPGRKQPNLIYQYRFAKQLPVRDSNDALKVNYVELQIRRGGDRKPTQSFRFIISLDVTEANAAEIVAAGRTRWKIENEGFNLLKKHGYNMKHNFGHGKQGLSDTLMALNLIAFAFHAVCNHLCELWQAARARFSRKHRLFCRSTPSTSSTAISILKTGKRFSVPQPRPPP